MMAAEIIYELEDAFDDQIVQLRLSNDEALDVEITVFGKAEAVRVDLDPTELLEAVEALASRRESLKLKLAHDERSDE